MIKILKLFLPLEALVARPEMAFYQKKFEELLEPLLFWGLLKVDTKHFPQMIDRDDSSEESQVAKLLRQVLATDTLYKMLWVKVNVSCDDNPDPIRVVVEFKTAIMTDSEREPALARILERLMARVRSLPVPLGQVLLLDSIVTLLALEMYHVENPDD